MRDQIHNTIMQERTLLFQQTSAKTPAGHLLNSRSPRLLCDRMTARFPLSTVLLVSRRTHTRTPGPRTNNSLADSATQMVEVIWPLSVASSSCRLNTSGLLSLRRFIEETLRRSRTSYSTLQVALYYLILIMPLVPKPDSPREQRVDTPSMRSLQCGRRMFLAALILASKYLQDRNYSAKAWSKMSGLKVDEINSNERAFLQAVNWKLHIPRDIYQRWTDVVLRYSTSAGRLQSMVAGSNCLWRHVIPLLTPELDTVAVSGDMAICSESARADTMSFASLPSFLEPVPEVVPPTPEFVPTLPTPRATPPRSFTPAASVTSTEAWPVANHAALSRRPSFVSSGSSQDCSPESTFSDLPRLSRSSSISSVSTSLTSFSSQSSVSAQACLTKLLNTRGMKPSQPVAISIDLTSSPVSGAYDEMSVNDCVIQSNEAVRQAWLAANRARVDKVVARSTAGLESNVSLMLAPSASRKRSHCGLSEEVEYAPRKQRCLSVTAHRSS